MKRLQCLYKPNKDKNYPWALKHPKVESALAVFKTRKDAMAWFLSLGYDCATWFQNDRKVWGGLLIAEKNPENGQMEYELNVEKFDGQLDYNETLKELNILENGLRDEKEAADSLAQVVDFKVLKDHHTYFPVDDDIVIERKKSKKDLEIEELRAKIAELAALLSSTNSEFHDEIQDLMNKLQDSSSDKELLNRQIEILKARQEALLKEQEQNVVEKPVEKEVIKEVEVVKEVIKEVPVYVKEDEVVKFAFFGDLDKEDKVKALALYANKVEKLLDKIEEQKVTSKEDYNEIKSNIDLAVKAGKELEKQQLEEDSHKLLKLAELSLAHTQKHLSDKVVSSNEIKNSPATAVYVLDEAQENVRLAQATSYVLYEYKHVAFVPEKDYKFAIFADAQKAGLNKFVVFKWPVEKEVVKETVVEKASDEDQSDDWAFKGLVVFSFALVWAALFTLAVLLGLGLII
ncbi:MAG3090 family protein [Mycoplasmopsis glycophila]|uniref:Uncharacterized protein n=1 Tax=Mycoplasmopsis glycophila TaxID=171285 RepID=A0A449AUS8_9BACT|nr:hypothetical protein [Mycoplasmopsis glycophila]VEU70267.1 Uncharacterised protein [Mycoplasmopsis glycophila]